MYVSSIASVAAAVAAAGLDSTSSIIEDCVQSQALDAAEQRVRRKLNFNNY